MMATKINLHASKKTTAGVGVCEHALRLNC